MWAQVSLPVEIELPNNWMTDTSWVTQLVALEAGDQVTVLPVYRDKISQCLIQQQLQAVRVELAPEVDALIPTDEVLFDDDEE